MKLKNITVGNLKNIDVTTLNMDTIIAVISTNNYGKSNLLEAIHFGFNFIAASVNNRISMMHWITGIPLSPKLAGKDYIFSIEFDDPELGKYRYVKYMFKFSWPTATQDGAIVDETIELRSDESERYTSYLRRDKGQYRAAKEKNCCRKILLPSNVLAIDILSSIDNVEISNAAAGIKTLSYEMCDTLGTNHSSVPFDNNETTRALSILKKHYPEKYNLFIETIHDLFPEFKSVDLLEYELTDDGMPKLQSFAASSDEYEKAVTNIPYHIKNEFYRLVINSKYLNQPVSMEYLSNGTKRIIWLITNAVFADCNGTNLIGADEIDTSIHPKMFYMLLKSLNNILGERSMIVTCHSPYLIQCLKPETIYIGVPNEYGVASFKRIRKSKIKTLHNIIRRLQTTIGAYLFKLLSGDEDSALILNAYLED